MSNRPLKVAFVCLGNICRSPLAEGAFRAHVASQGLSKRFLIDSAGTSSYHVGELPDQRSIAVAARHDVDISGQRSRQFVSSDLQEFDYVIAMDRSNQSNINALSSGEQRAEVTLLLDEGDTRTREVPDPYYGGPGGFDHVWQLVNEATESLLQRIISEHM